MHFMLARRAVKSSSSMEEMNSKLFGVVTRTRLERQADRKGAMECTNEKEK